MYGDGEDEHDEDCWGGSRTCADGEGRDGAEYDYGAASGVGGEGGGAGGEGDGGCSDVSTAGG